MTCSFSGFNLSISADKTLQDRPVGAEIYLTTDTYYRPADEPGLFQHQVDKFAIGQLVALQAKLLEAGTLEVEHFAGRSPLEQLLNLGAGEGVFKKVAVVDFDVLLRKKLFRLAAGISFYPAVKIDFHGYIASISIPVIRLFEQRRPDYRVEDGCVEGEIPAAGDRQPVRDSVRRLERKQRP